MGLFRKSDDKRQIEELKEELRTMRERLDEADAAKAQMQARLDATDASKAQLEARVDASEARLDATDAATEQLRARTGSIDAIGQELSDQAGSVDSLNTQVRQLAERMIATEPPEPPAKPPPPLRHPDPATSTAGDDPTRDADGESGGRAGTGASSDARIDEIEQRLADLDEVNERLDALSDAVTRQASAALSGGDEEIDPGQIGDMANRLEDLSVAVATHGTQLAATRERVDLIETTEASVVTDERTQEAVDDMKRQLGQMAERVSSLDRRLTNVSTELANQLTELSRDIDEVADRPPTLPPPMAGAGGTGADGRSDAELDMDQLDTDELELRLAEKFDMAIEDVRSSQERLAAEQARYEIKFREDLAELADRLRRPRTS